MRKNVKGGLFEILEMEECARETSVSLGNCLICGTRVMLRGGIACARWLVLGESVRERVARFLFYDRRVGLNRAEAGTRNEKRGITREGAGKRPRGRAAYKKTITSVHTICARISRVWAVPTITSRQIRPR